MKKKERKSLILLPQDDMTKREGERKDNQVNEKNKKRRKKGINTKRKKSKNYVTKKQAEEEKAKWCDCTERRIIASYDKTK